MHRRSNLSRSSVRCFLSRFLTPPSAGSWKLRSFYSTVKEEEVGTPVIQAFYSGLAPIKVGPLARALGEKVSLGVYQLHRSSGILPTSVRRVLRERDTVPPPTILIKDKRPARENAL